MNLWSWVRPGFTFRHITLGENTTRVQGVIITMPEDDEGGCLAVKTKNGRVTRYEVGTVERGYAEGIILISKPES